MFGFLVFFLEVVGDNTKKCYQYYKKRCINYNINSV